MIARSSCIGGFAIQDNVCCTPVHGGAGVLAAAQLRLVTKTVPHVILCSVKETESAMTEHKFADDNVEAVFDGYPSGVRARLLELRALIFEIAADAFSVAAYQTLLAIHGAAGHHDAPDGRLRAAGGPPLAARV